MPPIIIIMLFQITGGADVRGRSLLDLGAVPRAPADRPKAASSLRTGCRYAPSLVSVDRLDDPGPRTALWQRSEVLRNHGPRPDADEVRRPPAVRRMCTFERQVPCQTSSPVASASRSNGFALFYDSAGYSQILLRLGVEGNAALRGHLSFFGVTRGGS
ncbi:hypothetical protein V8D89_012027 [Ganoderma adspersum]